MKKLILIAATSTLVMAGGDIPVIQTVQDIPTVEEDYFSPSVFKSYEWKFIGLTFSTDREHNSLVEDTKRIATGIRAGIQNRQYRALLSYKTDFSIKDEFSIETDYLFDSFDVNELSAKPYIGASLYSIKHKKYDTRDAAYGLNVGLLVNISKNIDLDFAYAHKRYRNSDMFDSQNSVSIGINYFF